MLPYNDHDYVLFEEPAETSSAEALQASTPEEDQLIGEAEAYIDGLLELWRSGSQDRDDDGQEDMISDSLLGIELEDADFELENMEDLLEEFLPTMMVPLTEDSVLDDALDSHNDGWVDETPPPSPVEELAHFTASTQTHDSNDVPDFVWVEAKCKTPDAVLVEEPKPSSRKRKGQRKCAPEQKRQKKPKPSPPCLPGTEDEVPLEHVTVDMVQHLKGVCKIRHFWDAHAELLLYRLLLGLLHCKIQPEMAILDNMFRHFWRNFFPNEYQMIRDHLRSQQLLSQMRLSQGGFFTVKNRVPYYNNRLNKATKTFPKQNGVALPAPPLEELSPELLDEYRGLDTFRFFSRAHAKYLLLSVLRGFNDMSRAEKTVLSQHCFCYWFLFHNELIC